MSTALFLSVIKGNCLPKQKLKQSVKLNMSSHLYANKSKY